MKTNLSINTARAQRRNSNLQSTDLISKPSLNVEERRNKPKCKLEILTQASEKTQVPFTRKKNRSQTGTTSPYSNLLLPENNKIPEDSLEKINNLEFKFPEIPTHSSSIHNRNKNSDITTYLISAKESLYDLRQEAKSYLSSSKKQINEAQKSRRSSFVIEDFRNYRSLCQSEIFQDPIKELTDSVIELKSKVLESERKKDEQDEESGNINQAIKKLEKNLEKFQELKLENETKNVGCAGNCDII